MVERSVEARVARVTLGVTLRFALLSCAVHIGHAGATVNADVVGRAYAVDGGELLYREHHGCSDDNTRCEVRYVDPQGRQIAFKQLDYSASPFRPSLVMRDLRAETEHRVEPPDREGLVVDAGFDNYVRSRWEQLAAGEEVTFDFQVVGFDRPIDMRAQAGGSLQCDEEKLCLRVEVDSWFLGLLAKPIELAYARDSRRLLRFVGVSNLRDAGGDSPVVDIRYDYADAAPEQPSGL